MLIRNPPRITAKNSVMKYIEVDLWSWMRDLVTGLFKLSFIQNFQCFRVDNLILPPMTEVSIVNQFNTNSLNRIPTSRIIVRQTGDAVILDGDTQWTLTHLYLKNPSANEVVISILFFA